MKKKEVNGLKKKKTFIEKMNSLDNGERYYIESMLFMILVIPISVLFSFGGNKLAINYIFKDGMINNFDNIVMILNSKIGVFLTFLLVFLILFIELYFVMDKKPSMKKYFFTILLGISLNVTLFVLFFPSQYIGEKQKLFVSEIVLENITVDSIETMKDTEDDGFLFQKDEHRYVVEAGGKNTVLAISEKMNKDGSFDFEKFEMNDETKTVRLNGWDYTIER